MRTTSLAVSLIAIAFAGPALAEPVLMSAEWAKDACSAWNKDLNMEPFESFLLLVGKVPSNITACPAK